MLLCALVWHILSVIYGRPNTGDQVRDGMKSLVTNIGVTIEKIVESTYVYMMNYNCVL